MYIFLFLLYQCEIKALLIIQRDLGIKIEDTRSKIADYVEKKRNIEAESASEMVELKYMEEAAAIMGQDTLQFTASIEELKKTITRLEAKQSLIKARLTNISLF